ncbi:MAG: hypothetical protein Q8P13_02090 [bacterium]|nr:hypothetical protein [bacterium]
MLNPESFRPDLAPQSGEGGASGGKEVSLDAAKFTAWKERYEGGKSFTKKDVASMASYVSRSGGTGEPGAPNPNDLDPRRLFEKIVERTEKEEGSPTRISFREEAVAQDSDETRPATEEDLERLAKNGIGGLREEESPSPLDTSRPPVELEDASQGRAPAAEDVDETEEEPQGGVVKQPSQGRGRARRADEADLEAGQPGGRTHRAPRIPAPPEPPVEANAGAVGPPPIDRQPPAPPAPEDDERRQETTATTPPALPRVEQSQPDPEDLERHQQGLKTYGDLKFGAEFQSVDGRNFKVMETKFVDVSKEEAERLHSIEVEKGLRGVWEEKPGVQIELALGEEGGKQSRHRYDARVDGNESMRELLGISALDHQGRRTAAVGEPRQEQPPGPPGPPSRVRVVPPPETQPQAPQLEERLPPLLARFDYTQLSEVEKADKVEEFRQRIQAVEEETRELQPGDKDAIVDLKRDFLRGGGEMFWARPLNQEGHWGDTPNEAARDFVSYLGQGGIFTDGVNTYRVNELILTGSDLSSLTPEQLEALREDVNLFGYRAVLHAFPGKSISVQYAVSNAEDQEQVFPRKDVVGAVRGTFSRTAAQTAAETGVGGVAAGTGPTGTETGGGGIPPETPPTTTAGGPEGEPPSERTKQAYDALLKEALEDLSRRGVGAGAEREPISEDLFKRILQVQNFYLANHRPEVFKDPNFNPLEDPVIQAIMTLRQRESFGSGQNLVRAILMLEGMKSDAIGTGGEGGKVSPTQQDRLNELNNLQKELEKNLRAEPRRGLVKSMAELMRRANPLKWREIGVERRFQRAAAFGFDYDLLQVLEKADYSRERIDDTLKRNLTKWEDELIAARAAGSAPLPVAAETNAQSSGTQTGGGSETTSSPEAAAAAKTAASAFALELMRTWLRTGGKMSQKEMNGLLTRGVAILAGAANTNPALAPLFQELSAESQEKGRRIAFWRFGKKAAATTGILMLITVAVIGLTSYEAFQQKQ